MNENDDDNTNANVASIANNSSSYININSSSSYWNWKSSNITINSPVTSSITKQIFTAIEYNKISDNDIWEVKFNISCEREHKLKQWLLGNCNGYEICDKTVYFKKEKDAVACYMMFA